ncbi:MAG: acyl-ACP--UDP-N-acetylglucosamine O-acyltransferase [Flavobacteriaceae bacterium]|jgi:UDP-N-acetylglucosamine acyltransferase|nr:acyl-ACP--UDP-N-acetylglucosamine O-acyltransferase [Flavobacteriaceae bacterium]
MIQPLTFVHSDAKIAENVVVESFSSINRDVEIGEGTWIGPNVTIMEGARIGKNCKIFPGTVISAEPQDLKYKGEKTLTYIGDNTVIRECVTINRGTTALGYTKIGNDSLVMATAHVAHDCIVGDNVILVNGVGLSGHVIIEDYVLLGGMTAVHQFNKVGRHSIVAGGSLVRKDVPPYTKAARDPLSYAGINSIGLRRRGFSSEKIAEIQSIYRVIFQKKLNVSQALNVVEAEFEATPERDEIIQFIQSSMRGVMKSFNAIRNLE